jgi:hypothetical protein
MPGGVPDRRPLPVYPDWSMWVKCPHGYEMPGDLDLIRSGQELRDPCPVAERARAEAEAERQRRRDESELYQLWVTWRFKRQLKRGMRLP